MAAIDLNCDLGEGFGNDAELMKYISSANIACGFHAGNATTMRQTAELAMKNGVAIGAHPGYPDRANFGRLETDLSPEEVFDIVVYQVSAMAGICQSIGARLNHVKPHGAMYNQAARSRELATAIAEAVKSVDENLVLYGLSGSFLISQAERIGLKTASEAFADRTYQPDGSLTPRDQPNALIENVERSVLQVLQTIGSQTVASVTGAVCPIRADTICLHGDGAHAVEFARALRGALERNGVVIRAVSCG